jgi:hydroxymethylbilane synthase
MPETDRDGLVGPAPAPLRRDGERTKPLVMSDGNLTTRTTQRPDGKALVIATRGSPLALTQTDMVRALLMKRHAGLAIDTLRIRTTGDRFLDISLATMGGKGLFTKELDEALLAGRADIAVHSMKDMPTKMPDGLVIAGVLEREDPRDVFIAHAGGGWRDLPAGSRIGTSSLRRGAQMRHARPDLQIVPFRGNVETRLRKMRDGEADATLLALAGLRRLGLADPHGDYPNGVTLTTDEMLPAPAQGAIGIVCREKDDATRAMIAAISHAPTVIAVTAERAALAALDGSCRTPIAALATLAGDDLSLRVAIFTPDGGRLLDTTRRGAAADAARLGHDAGEELRERGGPGFFAAADAQKGSG